MLEQPERGTLNVESIDYTTNPIQEEECVQQAPLPAIDNLSAIPEVPEYPSGI